MIRILLALVLALLHYLAAAGSTSETVTFHSRALDRETTYIAVLPQPLAPARRYPVLYLLHGAYGGYTDWTSNTRLLEYAEDHEMVIITPEGGPFGWYLDSPTTAGKRMKYETFIVRDLLEEVDSRFPSFPSRQGRGIAGLSMGGHGALSLALKHPDLFISASSLSGILHLENHSKSWELPQRLGALPGATENWRRHSVYHLVENLTTSTPLRLMFDTGTSDTLAVTDNRQVHERLVQKGINHEYHEFPGGHTWKYWDEHLPRHLRFHTELFLLDSSRPAR